jgi:hypothetical protein
MSPEQADALVPLAAELVGTVRDYGPDAVADVLARVPEGRHDALAVVLAAMVDPNARPQQLLAWMELGPVPSRDWESPVFSTTRRACPDCGQYIAAKVLARHRRRRHREMAA